MSVINPIPILDNVEALAAQYPAWLCDIWGVLHNGVRAYPEASEALRRYRAGGGVVVLITNAPRPHPSVREQIASLGVPPAAYDAIVTSGDVTRLLIEAEAGRGLYHLGPERDLVLYEGLQAKLVAQSAAEVVVCTGLLDDASETPADYAQQLAAFRARAMPMICANPDIVVERGTEICYCAGALGEAYEAIGGTVAYAGKPKLPIYRAALAAAAEASGRTFAKKHVLAIGDGLKTDMLGAQAFGVDALFVASAIHLEDEMTTHSLAHLFELSAARPVAAISRLVW